MIPGPTGSRRPVTPSEARRSRLPGSPPPRARCRALDPPGHPGRCDARRGGSATRCRWRATRGPSRRCYPCSAISPCMATSPWPGVVFDVAAGLRSRSNRPKTAMSPDAGSTPGTRNHSGVSSHHRAVQSSRAEPQRPQQEEGQEVRRHVPQEQRHDHALTTIVNARAGARCNHRSSRGCSNITAPIDQIPPKRKQSVGGYAFETRSTSVPRRLFG